MLNGRCASVQRAAEPPPVVRRTAPSNMRIKLTAKLKKRTAFSLLAAYPPPVRLMAYATLIVNNAVSQRPKYKVEDSCSIYFCYGSITTRGYNFIKEF